MKFAPALFLLPLLAGCVSAPPVYFPAPAPAPAPSQPIPPSEPPPPPQAGFRAPEVMQGQGLAGVIRARGPALLTMFGPARLDVAEGDMRKLQFAGQACVLDIYLYPLSEGTEPVATWVQARRASDGREVDRAACIAALRRR